MFSVLFMLFKYNSLPLPITLYFKFPVLLIDKKMFLITSFNVFLLLDLIQDNVCSPLFKLLIFRCITYSCKNSHQILLPIYTNRIWQKNEASKGMFVGSGLRIIEICLTNHVHTFREGHWWIMIKSLPVELLGLKNILKNV